MFYHELAPVVHVGNAHANPMSVDCVDCDATLWSVGCDDSFVIVCHAPFVTTVMSFTITRIFVIYSSCQNPVLRSTGMYSTRSVKSNTPSSSSNPVNTVGPTYSTWHHSTMLFLSSMQ